MKTLRGETNCWSIHKKNEIYCLDFESRIEMTQSLTLIFFSYRTISKWNQLPSDIVISKSLVLFKKKLKCYIIADVAISKL